MCQKAAEGRTIPICSRLAVLVALVAAPAAASPGDLAAYVRARAADAAGDPLAATRAYAAALAADPDNPVIAIRAYREGLEAGDLALAYRGAAVLRRLGVAPADAALQPLAEAARADDPRAARAAVAGLAHSPLQPLAASFTAWVAWREGGDWQAALAGAGRDLIARRFADETRVLLLLAAKRNADGLVAFRALPEPRADLRLAAAALLAGNGDKRDARALLAGDDEVLEAAAKHPPKARASLGFGIARLYTGVGIELSGDDPSPLVIALARGALRADPGDTRARLLVADQLARIGQPARALAELGAVSSDSPYASVARTARVAVSGTLGDPAAALAAARALAERRDAEPYDIEHYAQALLAQHQADAAAAQFARLVAAAPTNAAAWLEYGGALDTAGRWPDARAALAKAVALAPDDPFALNYLGYARIAHGEDVPASEAMLARAAKLKPDDASITDSLAWAYFQDGRVARALPMLERAAEGEPANGTIAEHLGDAYWATGRRYEARYAWRAAALTADAGDAARLQQKIARGPAGVKTP